MSLVTGTRNATIYYGGFAFRGGGAFMHAQLLQKELDRAGWSVRLITLECLPLPLRYLPHLVSKIVNWFSSPIGFHYKGGMTRFLYKWLFDYDTDIKIFEDIYLSWNSPVPSVTLVHAVWSDNLQGIPTKAAVVARLIAAEQRTIDAINHPMITVSDQYRSLLSRTHGGSHRLAQISVVPLGLDISEFDSSSHAERAAKSLVYCGALEPRKNLLFLFEVFRQLHEQDGTYRLTIIGNGVDLDQLERFVSQHSLPVRFCGRLSREAVITELRQHTLYVHPSTKESFSFALLEAKVMGLITIAFEGLEVPGEFIDVPVRTFDVLDWLAAIKSADNAVPKAVNQDVYSTRRMTNSTLELAFGASKDLYAN